MTEPILRIRTREELIALARDLAAGDWHEPDEQEITATVHGVHFDTAGFWPLGDVTMVDGDTGVMAGIPDPRPTPGHAEIYVTLHHAGKPVAHVNLGSLFLWATSLCGHVSPDACRRDPDSGGQADG
ncbi:hypothetical protein AB0M39_41890 [Streptomyces sp. NPDC051907]|uniref:hypothetical protein n=1 Tax=Streptomyces sp. NPDC051907 TaxID=3155284 RepID=UPI003438C8E4